jgi:hypothetical protein
MRAGTCSYVKPNGRRCGSLALRGRDQCHYHVAGARREPRAQTQRVIAKGPTIELPELEDIPSIHKALTLVMNGILDGSIESKPAGQLLYALQLARTNLDRSMDSPLEEVGSIQFTLMEVMRELLHGRMETRAAGKVLYAVQLALKNLKDGIDLPPEQESEAAF